jgi:hypothetical protein
MRTPEESLAISGKATLHNDLQSLHDIRVATDQRSCRIYTVRTGEMGMFLLRGAWGAHTSQQKNKVAQNVRRICSSC